MAEASNEGKHQEHGIGLEGVLHNTSEFIAHKSQMTHLVTALCTVELLRST